MKILILDNYDSFTYNLVHMVEDIIGIYPDVYRNDAIRVEAIKKYDMLFLSPGPGIPDEAGILKQAIKAYAGKMPIFGVCLGMQAIVEVFGGSIFNMDKVYHGVATTMRITDKDAVIFKDMSKTFDAARYHSWIASKENFPKELIVTSRDEDDEIMSLQHKDLRYRPCSFIQNLYLPHWANKWFKTL